MTSWLEELRVYFNPQIHTELSIHHLRDGLAFFLSNYFPDNEMLYQNFYIKKYKLNPEPNAQSEILVSEVEEKEFRSTLVMFVFGLLQYASEYPETIGDSLRILYKTTQNISFKHMQAFLLMFVNFTEEHQLKDERFRIAEKLFDSIGETELANAAREKRASPSYWINQMYSILSERTIEYDINFLANEYISKKVETEVKIALESPEERRRIKAEILSKYRRENRKLWLFQLPLIAFLISIIFILESPNFVVIILATGIPAFIISIIGGILMKNLQNQYGITYKKWYRVILDGD